MTTETTHPAKPSPSDCAYTSALEAPRPTRWAVVELPLLDGARVVVVESTEDVADAAAVNPGVVVYTARELRELERHATSPNLLRAAHRIKRALDAQIIPRDSALGAWSRERTAIPAEVLLGHNMENENDE